MSTTSCLYNHYSLFPCRLSISIPLLHYIFFSFVIECMIAMISFIVTSSLLPISPLLPLSFKQVNHPVFLAVNPVRSLSCTHQRNRVNSRVGARVCTHLHNPLANPQNNQQDSLQDSLPDSLQDSLVHVLQDNPPVNLVDNPHVSQVQNRHLLQVLTSNPRVRSLLHLY